MARVLILEEEGIVWGQNLDQGKIQSNIKLGPFRYITLNGEVPIGKKVFVRIEEEVESLEQ